MTAPADPDTDALAPGGERPRAADTRMKLNAATRQRTRQASFSLPKLKGSSFVLARRPEDGTTPADVPWGFDADTAGPDAAAPPHNGLTRSRSRFMPLSRSLSLMDRSRPVGALYNQVKKDAAREVAKEVEERKEIESSLEVEMSREADTSKEAAPSKEVEEEIVGDVGDRIRGTEDAKVALTPVTPPVSKPRLSGQLFKTLTGRMHKDRDKGKYMDSSGGNCNCKKKQKCCCKCKSSPSDEGASNARLADRPKARGGDGDNGKDRDRLRCHSRGRERPHRMVGLFRRAQSSSPHVNESKEVSELDEKVAISPMSDDKSSSMVILSLNRWRSRNHEVEKERSLVKSTSVQQKKDDQDASKRSLALPHWRGFGRRGKQKANENVSEDGEEEILVIADVVNSLAHDDFIDFQAHLNEKGKRHRFRRGKRDDSSDE